MGTPEPQPRRIPEDGYRQENCQTTSNCGQERHVRASPTRDTFLILALYGHSSKKFRWLLLRAAAWSLIAQRLA